MGMVLVVIGLFVLVWIISAVVKASQAPPPKPQRPQGPMRPRPEQQSAPRPDRTANTDIDRFMAEIDRLRQRGEGAPAARPEPPKPKPEPKPRPAERVRERRPRPTSQTSAPPPRPSDPVPILRPLASDTTAPSTGTVTTPAKTARTIKPASTATVISVSGVAASPVLIALQTLLQSKQGPAAAMILAEIFGDPPGKRAMTKAQTHIRVEQHDKPS